MVILIVHNMGVTVNKTECYAPIGLHCYSPDIFHVSLKLVQTKTGSIHIFYNNRLVKQSQNEPQFPGMCWLDAGSRTCLEQLFQPFMRECFYHAQIVTQWVTCVNRHWILPAQPGYAVPAREKKSGRNWRPAYQKQTTASRAFFQSVACLRLWRICTGYLQTRCFLKRNAPIHTARRAPGGAYSGQDALALYFYFSSSPKTGGNNRLRPCRKRCALPAFIPGQPAGKRLATHDRTTQGKPVFFICR